MFRRRVYIGTESNNSSGRTKLHVNVEYSVTLYKHEMNRGINQKRTDPWELSQCA